MCKGLKKFGDFLVYTGIFFVLMALAVTAIAVLAVLILKLLSAYGAIATAALSLLCVSIALAYATNNDTTRPKIFRDKDEGGA